MPVAVVIRRQVVQGSLNGESVPVLSDIHGVLPVLDAVLAESDVGAADLIVATYDHAAGPSRRAFSAGCWRTASVPCWCAATPTENWWPWPAATKLRVGRLTQQTSGPTPSCPPSMSNCWRVGRTR